ncbi:flagellar hook-length control protein FliK [Marinimicrobium agarilyticum]|uniref:flagellar hook-length control protein FliK n=1 Tax=Marinimicrobium agarilyticum TaxID=306546 RepID=UPI0003F988FE|nr:flagellar hook-length control protein FliK [Marinimicrobium agarilyticum]
MVNKLPEGRLPLTLPTETPAGQRPAAPQGLMQILAQQLGRTPQAATTAEVQTVTSVNIEQRQQLINRLVDTLLQWQSRPDSAQKTEQLARLADERALLNSPLLKLVRLMVRQESVVTYTDQPLKPGQRVPMYLAEGRLWQLDAKPQTGTETRQTLSEPVRQALLETLRRALPLKDQPDLTPQLPKIQSLTYMQQRQLLSPTLQQALRQVAQQIRHPLQLAQPKALRQSVENSGVQLEQKLMRALQEQKATTEGQAPRPEATRGETIARTLANDWKGALLKVLSSTRTELGRLGQSPEFQRPSELNLTQLLQQLSARPAPELADRSLRTQLLQMVHQLTLNSLARVQFQQSQGLAQQFAPADAGQPVQTWTMDIPLRFGQDVLPLMLRFEPEAGQDEAGQRSGKIRQWQVQLSFELPEAGHFYAQITVREQQVATRLWAEQPQTADTIRTRLNDLQHRLEKEGIEVTKLECHTGTPPRPMTDIHYSLVDITT